MNRAGVSLSAGQPSRLTTSQPAASSGSQAPLCSATGKHTHIKPTTPTTVQHLRYYHPPSHLHAINCTAVVRTGNTATRCSATTSALLCSPLCTDHFPPLVATRSPRTAVQRRSDVTVIPRVTHLSLFIAAQPINRSRQCTRRFSLRSECPHTRQPFPRRSSRLQRPTRLPQRLRPNRFRLSISYCGREATDTRHVVTSQSLSQHSQRQYQVSTPHSTNCRRCGGDC